MSHQQRIVVTVSRQRMELLEQHAGHEEITASYPISTSRFGLGNTEGSFCTPTGRFKILEKIGECEPLWMIFQHRQPTGHLADPGGEEDLILTRILWLEGLDPENRNTRERYIYIHGTNQEHLIGLPASHGCIRLRNHEMSDFFQRIHVGTVLDIQR
jgi:hypothetical protein